MPEPSLPSGVGNMMLWLRGDAGVHIAPWGGPLAVADWYDQSPNKFDFVQDTPQTFPQNEPCSDILTWDGSYGKCVNFCYLDGTGRPCHGNRMTSSNPYSGFKFPASLVYDAYIVCMTTALSAVPQGMCFYQFHTDPGGGGASSAEHYLRPLTASGAKYEHGGRGAEINMVNPGQNVWKLITTHWAPNSRRLYRGKHLQAQVTAPVTYQDALHADLGAYVPTDFTQQPSRCIAELIVFGNTTNHTTAVRESMSDYYAARFPGGIQGGANLIS